MKKFLYPAMLLSMAVCFQSCSDDDPEPTTPDTPGLPSPNDKVDDPDGTVTISMRNANNGETWLEGIYIDNGDNFYNANFRDYGEVAGLGNVASIPKTGYASKAASIPGHGYVAYSNNKWIRMYVTGYTVNVLNEVIGSEVKYQTPFYGVNEALKSDDNALTFDSDGGNGVIQFTNETIIPFTLSVDEEGAQWCQATTASTLDRYFLTDAVSIQVSPSDRVSTQTATVTATTGYGKEFVIKVTRTGAEPYLELNHNNSSYYYDEKYHFDCTPRQYNIGITTNVAQDIQVSTDASWLSATFNDNSRRTQARSSALRYIGTEEVSPQSRAGSSVNSYNLLLDIEENIDAEERHATVTIVAGGIRQSFEVIQGVNTLSMSSSYITDNGYGTTIPAQNYSGYYAISSAYRIYTDMEAVSDATWCRVTRFDFNNLRGELTLDIDINPGEERTANVTIRPKGGTLALTFKVTQQAGGVYLDGSNQPVTMYIDKSSQTRTFYLSSTTEDYQPKSNASWLSFHQNGANFNVIIEPTTENREGRITFEGTSMYIDVKQTKYAIGDTYDQDGVAAQIYRLGNEDNGTGRIYFILDGWVAYSTQNIFTGATSKTDGEQNTTIIHSIPNWEETYPLFATVDGMNVNGATGWYVPAIDEMPPSLISCWSSTESDISRSYYKYNGNSTSLKSTNLPFMAVRKVNLFEIE